MKEKTAEADLIKGCLQNNIYYQRQLYERYAGKMLMVCLRYATSRAEAEDILQEGFIIVFDNLKTFRMEGSFEGWIRKIMIHAAIRNSASRKVLYSIPPHMEAEQEETETFAGSDLSMEELVAFIQQLPEGYRIVFNMYVIDNFSHKEIAEKLSISEGTSKSQLARARKALQKMIKDHSNTIYDERVEEKNS